MPEGFSAADTGWVLIASALVFFMIPGLALFYGGLSRTKSVLNMMMMSYASVGIVTLIWIAFGYALTFGQGNSAYIGSLGWSRLESGINTLAENGATLGIPVVTFAIFQLMFAAITPALISGALADRAKFSTWMIFTAIWVTVVYFPIAHWVFSFGNNEGEGAGFLAHMGVLDFAGGTAVHINAGAAALAACIVLGTRMGWKKKKKADITAEGIHDGHSETMFRPHNIPFVLLGAGILWFGWFGFNAGSALAVNGTTGLAFMNTIVGGAAGMLGWMLYEYIKGRKITSVGAASGVVAGLVAITPACAFVGFLGGAAIGLIAGVVCAFAVGLKYRVGYDDSLDVVGVHLVGGILGSLLIGIFATKLVNSAGGDGLLSGGGFSLLGKQALAVVIVGGYSFIITYALSWILDKTIGFRASEETEIEGIDYSEHLETAYDDSIVSPRINSNSVLHKKTISLTEHDYELLHSQKSKDDVKQL